MFCTRCVDQYAKFSLMAILAVKCWNWKSTHPEKAKVGKTKSANHLSKDIRYTHWLGSNIVFSHVIEKAVLQFDLHNMLSHKRK